MLAALPDWVDSTFAAEVATILSFLLALCLALFGGRKLSRLIRQRSAAKASHGGQAISTSGTNNTVIVVHGNVHIPPEEFERAVEHGSIPDASEKPASPPPPPPADERLEKLITQLEEALAHYEASISEVLLAAHRLAKHRDDRTIMRWLECEIDGYSEEAVSTLPDHQTDYRRIKGYFLMAYGPARHKDFDRLPYPFFEAKSASKLEEAVRTLRPLQESASITIRTPDSVRDFFRQQKLEIDVPPHLTLYIEVAQLDGILTELRKRIRDYLRALP